MLAQVKGCQNYLAQLALALDEFGFD